jgi:hypothetical protein
MPRDTAQEAKALTQLQGVAYGATDAHLGGRWSYFVAFCSGKVLVVLIGWAARGALPFLLVFRCD